MSSSSIGIPNTTTEIREPSQGSKSDSTVLDMFEPKLRQDDAFIPAFNLPFTSLLGAAGWWTTLGGVNTLGLGPGDTRVRQSRPPLLDQLLERGSIQSPSFGFHLGSAALGPKGA
jgi:hypothetical protein